MNTIILEYITEVANLKSINKAAKSLHITQPTISQAISTFEEEVGFPIFIRTQSGTFPSQRGKLIIEKAVKVIEQIDELEDLYEQNKIAETLRLAAIPGVMPLLVKTATNYQKDNKHMELFLTEGSTEEIINHIFERKLDAGLIVRSKLFKEGIKDLIFEPIVTGKIIAVVNSASPYANQNFITIEQLKESNFVFYNDQHVKHFESEFTKRYGELSILFRTNNLEALFLSIIEQNTVSIGHDYSLQYTPHFSSGKVVPLEIKGFDQLSVEIGWLRNKHTPLNKQATKFINNYKMN